MVHLQHLQMDLSKGEVAMVSMKIGSAAKPKSGLALPSVYLQVNEDLL